MLVSISCVLQLEHGEYLIGCPISSVLTSRWSKIKRRSKVVICRLWELRKRTTSLQTAKSWAMCSMIMNRSFVRLLILYNTQNQPRRKRKKCSNWAVWMKGSYQSRTMPMPTLEVHGLINPIFLRNNRMFGRINRRVGLKINLKLDQNPLHC